MVRPCRAVVLVELFVATGASRVAAQGVTTASLYGVVRGSDSAGIGDAVVTLTNSADGGRWRTTTHADGRYVFEYRLNDRLLPRSNKRVILSEAKEPCFSA